jgi:hypothetical protein
MADPVLRVNERAYKEASQLAVKRGVRMKDIGNEIALAGLAWFAAGGRVVDGVAVPPDGAAPGPLPETSETPEEDRETLLSRALRNIKVMARDGEESALTIIDTEAERWNASARGKKEPRGRVEATIALLSTAIRRLGAVRA